jgi:hypothetical protein
LLLLFYCTGSLVRQGVAHGFKAAAPLARSTPRYRTVLSRSKLSARDNPNDNVNDDDEIAKLEAQLQKLRQDKRKQQQQQQSSAAPALSPAQMERVLRSDMILSEQDLLSSGIVQNANDKNNKNNDESATISSSSNNNNGGLVGTVVTAAVVLAALLLFAQVPVGQDDLARYSPAAGLRNNNNNAASVDLGDMNPSRPPQ